MEFGERIKQQRTKLGMTQAEIAEKLYITRQTVSNWEQSKNYPDLSMLLKISDVYQVSIDSLLKADNELKEYLERKTVNNKFDFLALFTDISTTLSAILLIIVLNDPQLGHNLFALIIVTALLISGIIVDILMERFKTYIGERDDNILKEKIRARTLPPFIVILIIITGVVYFINNGKWNAIYSNLTTILIIFALAGLIFYIVEFTINWHLQKREENDHEN